MHRPPDTSSLAGRDSESHLSRYTDPSADASHNLTNYRPAKRRCVAGLNTRFDRMVKSVNTTLSHSNRVSLRKRILSSGTSSVSSHDIPKTPIDAFSGIDPGKLGKDFSVQKTKRSLRLPREDIDGFPKPVAPPKEPKSPLPDWLAHTFRSLEANHPLRGLLSPSRKSKSDTPPVEPPGVPREEKIFAFSPSELDQQEGPLGTAYHADGAPDIESVWSAIPAKPMLSNSQLEALAIGLPSSTPGCFAPASRSGADSMFQKPSVSQQVTFHASNMMYPPALLPSHLRLDDEIAGPQISDAFSSLVQYNDPPLEFQAHDAYINYTSQVSGGGDDGLNVYATPGPTFACSRPVYFDSPTEDPSLSDPLLLESYELDLNAIDFRWRPFLRSNLQERGTDGQSTFLPPSLGRAMPNLAGDQNGRDVRFTVDQEKYGASSDEFPSLTEDVEVHYPCNATQPSNVKATKLRSVSPLTSDAPLSPLLESVLLGANGARPCGDEGNVHSKEALPSLRGKEMRPIELRAREARPLTPIRHLPVSPPSAPQKVRLSQPCGIPRAPVRKMSSVLPWMMPSKLSKRTTTAHGDVKYRLSHVLANPESHDSIESWNESG